MRAAGPLAVLFAALAVLAAPAAGGGVSSNAHRPDSSGNYGGLRSGRPLPGRPVPGRPVPALPLGPLSGERSSALKQPYPYRYYSDTNRSISGCYWMARRAIETNNRNWWLRYRACTGTARD